jgi:hypothetical protein
MGDCRVRGFAGIAAPVFLALTVVAAQAQEPDLSGIYWTKQYNAKIELVGGGELPFTPAGKKAYEANIAGFKDGSTEDTARTVCVPDGLPRVWANPYPLRDRVWAAGQRDAALRAQPPGSCRPHEQGDAA